MIERPRYIETSIFYRYEFYRKSELIICDLLETQSEVLLGIKRKFQDVYLRRRGDIIKATYREDYNQIDGKEITIHFSPENYNYFYLFDLFSVY